MNYRSGKLVPLAVFLAASPSFAHSPYTVFFDSGSARLTDQALTIIGYAAEAVRIMDAREIEIVGAADRAGPVSYNLQLSRLRAEAIRAALIERGVNPAIIARTVIAGESRPLVETADGVAEAQNRYGYVVFLSWCRGPDNVPLGCSPPSRD